MTEYLFYATIAYELFQIVGQIRRLKLGNWTAYDIETCPDLEKRKAYLAFSILVSTLFIFGAAIALFSGGLLTLIIVGTYALFCALGSAMYAYAFAEGRRVALAYALYNFAMMFLFAYVFFLEG